MGRVCAFLHCSNSTYQLERWRSQVCETHNTKHAQCQCAPPFALYPFPTEKRNKEQRMKWIRIVDRHNTTTGELWIPSQDDRICSWHFIDNKRSSDCPDPVINLTEVKEPIKCDGNFRTILPNTDGTLPTPSIGHKRLHILPSSSPSVDKTESHKRKITETTHTSTSASKRKSSSCSESSESEKMKTDSSENNENSSLKLKDLLSIKRIKLDENEAKVELDQGALSCSISDSTSVLSENRNSDSKCDGKTTFSQSLKSLLKTVDENSSKKSATVAPLRERRKSARLNSISQENDCIVSERRSPRLKNRTYEGQDPWKDNRKSQVNGVNVPLAYDTNISLLKLAYKLKGATEKLKAKRSRVKSKNGNKSKAKEEIVSRSPPKTSISSNRPSATDSQKALVPKNISIPLVNIHGNGEVSSSKEVKSKPIIVTQVNVQASKEPETFIEMDSIKLPTVPKHAVDILSCLKNRDDEVRTDVNLSCTSLPLWPVLGAAKDAALKMDTSYLNKYVPAQNHSGRNMSLNTRKSVQSSDRDGTGDCKESQLDLESLNIVPQPLDEVQCEAVVKIGESTLLEVNLPKVAKRALDLCRLWLEDSKKTINQSLLRQRWKLESKKLNAAAEKFPNSRPTVSGTITKVLNLPTTTTLKLASDVRNVNQPTTTTLKLATDAKNVNPSLNSKFTVSLLKGNNFLKSPLLAGGKMPATSVSSPPTAIPLMPIKLDPKQVPPGQLIFLVKDMNGAHNKVELVSASPSLLKNTVVNNVTANTSLLKTTNTSLLKNAVVENVKVKDEKDRKPNPTKISPPNSGKTLADSANKKSETANTISSSKNSETAKEGSKASNSNGEKSGPNRLLRFSRIIEALSNSNANDDNKGNIPRKYQCSHCEYRTDNRSHLRRHESSVHSGDKMYRCYVCRKEFARSEKCRTHIEKTHPEVDYDSKFIRKEQYKFTHYKQHLAKKRSKKAAVGEASHSPCHKDDTEPSESVLPTVLVAKEKEGSNDAKDGALSNKVSLEGESESGEESEDSTSPPDKLSTSPSKLHGCDSCSYVARDAWHLKRHISDVHDKCSNSENDD